MRRLAGARRSTPTLGFTIRHMSPATIALLDRRLARVFREQGWGQGDALTQALAVLHPIRTASISNAFDVFRSASATAQHRYGNALSAEVALVVEKTQLPLDSDGKSQFLEVVTKYLNFEMYSGSFSKLEEAIVRHFGRAGVSVDLAPFRPDLSRLLYDVGSKNFVLATTAKITDDLELVVLRQQTASSQPQHLPSVERVETKLEQANRLFKLEPNLFGFGVNLNYLLRRLMGKKE